MAWRWLNDKVRSEVLHVTWNGKGAGGIHAYFAFGRAAEGGKSGRVRVMLLAVISHCNDGQPRGDGQDGK
ncbi:hypothetical protein V3481_017203 [Fusarium oxysporum f. sp. vasinfectum]